MNIGCLPFALGLILMSGDGASPPLGQDIPKPLAETKRRLAETGPKPNPVNPPSAETFTNALNRGIDYLLICQHADGSWGSARGTKGLNIYAPVPGAHDAFRAATTALCICALHEIKDGRPKVQEALHRGETWLLSNLPEVRRATPDALYNVWAHGYAIAALVKMLNAEPADSPRRKVIEKEYLQQVDRLRRYESVDGGWGYYDFEVGAQRPAASSTSFVTATILVSLREAKDAGLPVPDEIIARATASILRQRKPDFSYLYGEDLKYAPMHPVNRPGGSLGRSQACNLALRYWGQADVNDAVLRTWLDRLFARNLWLDLGRKKPIPHESWFAVAGYFFYYGHYYAARCLEELPLAERAEYQAHLAAVLLPLQEKDGSWWDYPLYRYHQPYGTAFAIMALQRCRSSKAETALPEATAHKSSTTRVTP